MKARWMVWLLTTANAALAWTPVSVTNDPLVRMPGSQHGSVSLEASSGCMSCHAFGVPESEPGFNWQGSMMAQSARDFLFWPTMVVAMQDSIWAVGNPNAADLCIRCHFPSGWLAGRSDPVNVSRMAGDDFDGISCHFCHQMYDPFFEDTYRGIREGSDWSGYWDEATAVSSNAAQATYLDDAYVSQVITYMNGLPFYNATNQPVSTNYRESVAGQFFVADSLNNRRGSYSDADTRNHDFLYSRYHSSKYFCGTCHDVSNPVLANLGEDGTSPLTSETETGNRFYHVERTFSEFMSSAYGQQGGAVGSGAFDPTVFNTSKPGNVIATCQDCHMRPVTGKAAKQGDVRPSSEHPKSGVPLHSFAGASYYVPWVLASSVPGSPVYDATNDFLLNQGPSALTLDLTQGLGLDPVALTNVADQALAFLEMAATLEQVNYDPVSGQLQFRVVNHTGHKLISGYPEGRRMFLEVKLYQDGNLIQHVNPYDLTAGTLKGLAPDYSPNSPLLADHELYMDELVYECQMSSLDLLGPAKTFHFALATDRYKDNRIPPRGFNTVEGGPRLILPVYGGITTDSLYRPEEYAGGYDDVELWLQRRADTVEVSLYYQSTSREYIEFLRDEINGVGNTLPAPTPSGEAQAYIIQTDPFFTNLTAWGDTVWQLWEHNKTIPGAAPITMVSTNTTLVWDTDGDRIPDAWELQHASSLTNMNESTDLDEDGFLDLWEFIADTLPGDPASYFSINVLPFSGTNGLTLVWDSRPHRVYQVQRSHTLTNGFTNLSLRLPAEPAGNQYTDPPPQPSPSYYRVKVLE